MRASKLIYGIVLLIVMLVLAGCTFFPKEKPTHISSIYGQKQFCLLYLEKLIEDKQIEHCFNYPLSAFTTKFNWFWIDFQSYNTRLLVKHGDFIEVAHNDESLHEAFILDPAKPVVYLTFDDGPGKYTDRILDILQAENIRATFFVLGIQVERNPLFTKRIADEGHTIGNHTYNHSYEEIYGSFATFADQVYETNRIVYELTGKRMTIFRAPGGSINNVDEGYRTGLERVGLTLFDWNIDSRDSVVRGIEQDDIVTNITNERLVNPAIVLLHDTSNHEQSMLALPQIIDYYREQGYQFAPITAATEPLTFNMGKNLKWNRPSVTKEQLLQFEQRMAKLYE